MEKALGLYQRSFNRKRFTQAASYWSAINHSYAPDYAMIALLAERGTIPPFQMDYEDVTKEEIPRTEQSEEEMQRYFSRGSVKMMCLRAALHPEVDDDLSSKMTEAMIIYGGEWGKRLGQEFFGG